MYALIFGVAIFKFYPYHTSNYLNHYSVERFFSDEESVDRVALIEDRFESGLARLHLIENAEESIDITYHTIHDGVATTLFLNSILNAADRDVHVRLLLDGLFHNLRFGLKDVVYTLTDHPNIEMKFYEPFDLVRPWVWNNRLHDKMIIVDHELAMIGGRNIGDKYFTRDNDKATNDRDVVILNTSPKTETSAVYSMSNYFNEVWEHPFSKKPVSNLSRRQQRKGIKKAEELKDVVSQIKVEMPEIFNQSFDWFERSVPTNNVTLIHNPIERFNKEPLVWYEITRLMEHAEHSVFIQSPYVIPTKKMNRYIDKTKLPKDITVLTNSLASTPNVIAFSGYTNQRNNILALGTNVYEYQGKDSLHAKTYILDDRISVVGSFNLDARSAFLSTETMVVIDSVEFTRSLQEEVNSYKANSLVVSKDGYLPNPFVDEGDAYFGKSFIVKTLSFFTRVIDFML